MSYSKPQIIQLECVDSTNNYAMGLIDGNKAQHGMTVTAVSQTNGKGQRGRVWVDAPGNSLSMSIILVPQHALAEQFLFNASVAVAIANVLRKLDAALHVQVKWPNDIIVNDKKAGGVLIENVLRGSLWANSIVGFGLNVNQAHFPPELPFATSLRICCGSTFDITDLAEAIRNEILEMTETVKNEVQIMQAFNNYLYKRGIAQLFSDKDGSWSANILQAQPDGTLQVQLKDGSIKNYVHGEAIWEYGS